MPDYIVKDAAILSRISKLADAIARDPVAMCNAERAKQIAQLADELIWRQGEVMTDAELPAPNISTAAIKLLALECYAEAREWASMQLEPMFERIAASLRALVAERNAQAAEIERLEAKLEKLIGGAETVLEAWDRGDIASFLEAIEEMRADVEEAKGSKDE